MVSLLREVFFKILDGRKPYPHQLKTAENLVNGKSVVLRAPCGSGKTEAAYAPLLLDLDNILPNRLVYSLPTRALVEDIAERITRGLAKTESKYTVSPQHGANSKDPFFRSDIIVATIDQTVGAYCCTPLSLPVHFGNIPAGAAVSSFLCFDEAHVYDYELGLQSMLVLLERAAKLGLPFLIMSATLPESFIEWFMDNPVFGNKVEVIEGNEKDIPKRRDRHVVLRWCSKILEAKDVIKAAETYSKIMVVCNTVDRAQNIYETVEKQLKAQDFDVYLLHSRFLDEDRKRIEKNMKASIRDKNVKSLIITTQVCEVGLDISCDLLLTELAPPDALVQRIGRCAREGGHGEVAVYDVAFPAPYGGIEIERSRNYVVENLDGKIIRWKEELEFVNSILNETFKTILNDVRRRYRVVLSLSDAAFKGDRYGIERNVREILGTNVTIWDNPETLKYEELLCMPWLNVDIRVLERYLNRAKYWEVVFEHDEYGKPSVDLKIHGRLYPYGFYIIHSDYAKYDTKMGLILGEKGSVLNPVESKMRDPMALSYDYEEETWVEHSRKCLQAFRRLKEKEMRPIRLLADIIGLDQRTTEGLLAMSVALHDLGKLNIKWQKSIGIQEDDTPLAHTAYQQRVPPHATISADAVYPIFKSLLPNIYFALAFKFAMAHHHHTRAEEILPYELGWRSYYKGAIREVCEEYSIDVDPAEIRTSENSYKKLETRMFNFEALKPFTAYCIISRILRLSDRESFAIKDENLFKNN
ncbi:MAG: CRISPR-associated helicase Cas3' [Candidatus Bathyarchaeia archaeon]